VTTINAEQTVGNTFPLSAGAHFISEVIIILLTITSTTISAIMITIITVQMQMTQKCEEHDTADKIQSE